MGAQVGAQLASAFPQRLRPEFVKVFWFFFSKKNRLLCRLPSVEAISIPEQLRSFFQKEHASFSFERRAPACYADVHA
jgi:hypothetical protein